VGQSDPAPAIAPVGENLFWVGFHVGMDATQLGPHSVLRVLSGI